MKTRTLAIFIATSLTIPYLSTINDVNAASNPAHVLLISVDGMHQQDMARCIESHSCPNISELAKTGINYSEAYTPGLSDSFPGLAALLTGGSPKSAGLFYDVSYDRTLYAPSDTECKGKQGWNVVFDETAGIDGLNGGKLIHLNGGGSFNPQAIPNAKINGQCVAVYPHNYITTNTLFEVIKQNLAGSHTAWADKHAWAYDWVNGPSGKGVDDLARTEIDSIDPKTGEGYTDKYTHTQTFDDMHVQIIINQIDGKDSTGVNLASVPTMFGTNFQTLSVAQKASHANGGGYIDAQFTPGPQVSGAITYVDHALGRIISELKAKNIYDSTLIIISAKHGQSPSDYTKVVKNGDTLVDLFQSKGLLDSDGHWGQANTKSGNPNDGSGFVNTGAIQTDDLGLIWLKDQNQLSQALAMINNNLGCQAPGICANDTTASILSGSALIEKFGDPQLGRTPDIIVQPNTGVIYTHSKKKDAEHGGNAPDDSHVALLVSMPSLTQQTISVPVMTTQVAPTILQALKLDPLLLNSVKSEGTKVLPDLNF